MIAAAILLILALAIAFFPRHDWQTADRSSAGIAALPEDVPEALVQLYTARAFNWRGLFAVHSWIATKEKNAGHYDVYHVVGFYLEQRGTVIVAEPGIPDGRWFNAEPTLLRELKGEKAEKAIPEIQAAAGTYPYARTYRAWPGPNSNTFISYILRRVPEIGVELPPHAIGKDWINDAGFFARSETGTGYQFSFFGVFGITLGRLEGLEINILGLNFGFDVLRPALKLPLIGRVGMKDAPDTPDR